jgi:retinol dehydrogenase 12
LARILYSKNASVYMLARSADKTNRAITSIREAVPSSAGKLVYLRLDLADLASIKGTVEQFLAKESKLHVLWNNAGVMSSEKQLVLTPQGYEQHVGVNVLGGFLLAKLLTPVLVSTAKS